MSTSRGNGGWDGGCMRVTRWFGDPLQSRKSCLKRKRMRNRKFGASVESDILRCFLTFSSKSTVSHSALDSLALRLRRWLIFAEPIAGVHTGGKGCRRLAHPPGKRPRLLPKPKIYHSLYPLC